MTRDDTPRSRDCLGVLMKDLFGNEIRADEIVPRRAPRRKVDRAHPQPPGTGPRGETCKTCMHYVIRRLANSYRKCAKMRKRWTGGPGTDIKAGDAACREWEKKK